MAEIRHLTIIFDKNKLFSIRNFINLDIINYINNIIYNNL